MTCDRDPWFADPPEERAELLEVLAQQAVSTIEFLHGCLTLPHHSYDYPEQTERLLDELRAALPEHHWCVHSSGREDCDGCRDGQHSREVRGRFRERREAANSQQERT